MNGCMDRGAIQSISPHLYFFCLFFFFDLESLALVRETISLGIYYTIFLSSGKEHLNKSP